MAKCILVIGAVLLDVVGKSSIEQRDAEDKIGIVDFSAGGVAFNIAVNLTQLGHDCQLFTCLRSNSPISQLIRRSIRNMRIGLDYIVEDENIPDATFMAVFCGETMVGALTSSPIERINLLVAGKLKSAISKAELVIADTNLSPEQIRVVHGICVECSVDLCLVSASDAKAPRILECQSAGKTLALVGMNEREARALGVVANDVTDHREICRKLGAQRVLLTMGQAGARFLDGHGIHRIPAPNVHPANKLGAGDALFSALCSCMMLKKSPYSEDGISIIVDTVSHVLGKDGPNLGDSRIVIQRKHGHEWLLGIICVLGVLLGYYVGLTVGLHGVAEHWTTTLAASAFVGAVGAWIHNISSSGSNIEAKNRALNLVSGLIVGCTAAIAGSIPSLATGDLVDLDGFNRNAMAIHFISSTMLALFAGIGLSRAVERLISQSLT
jgi:sugar/nucleoside kinase (ribokinase family)